MNKKTDCENLELRMLRKKELALLLNVSERHLQRLIAIGDVPGPSLTLGRSPRWDRRIIETFVATGIVPLRP